MRLVWLIINIVLWTIILSILAIVVGLVDWSGRGVRWVARIWSQILLAAAGVRYTLIGAELLDRDKHYIFAGNHESAFDISLCFAAIPHHIVSIAKIELRRIPVFGWAIFMAGHIFVDRKNRESAVKSMAKARRSIERNPRSILIFPEGTRSLDGEIHEFKKGAAVLGLTLGLPIVPMAMCGTSDVIRKHSWTLRPRPIELRLGQPIEVAGLEYKDRHRLTIELREQVIKLKREWQAEQAN